MSDADRDIAALFEAEAAPVADAAFVARVAKQVAAARRGRARWAALGGLVIGLGACAGLALAAPVLTAMGRGVAQIVAAPGATWGVVAAGLALAIGVPLYRAR